MLSQLNENLVLLFYDYITEAPFLSYIGKNKLADTAHELIAYSQLHYQENTLKLIPGTVATQLPDSEFTVIADENSHDYIVSVPYLCSLDTLPRSNNKAGYSCQKFLRLYPHFTFQNQCIKGIEPDEYTDLFTRWAKIQSLDHLELNEYSAFERFIHNTENENHIVSIYDGNTIIGFGSYELLTKDYAISHFSKADRNYTGIYDELYFLIGKALQEAGIRYWNFEQDLGLPGLRQAKRKYKPEFYLKKFIVEKKN